MQELENLINVAEIVRRHGRPEIATWLDDALSQYLTSPERITFDKALGFGSIHGIPSQRTRFMKDRRNHHLKLAYDCTNPDERPTVRCDLLAMSVREFESRFYVNWKRQGGPPVQTSELRRHIWLAKLTGQKIDFSGRALYRLLFDI